MSVEIIENFSDLKPFQYLLSMSYDEFKKLYLRGTKEKENKEVYTKMISYCNSVVKAKGTITRVYNYSINSSHGIGGRLFSGSSIQGICREVRGFLMKHTTDIDMKNAHPKILLYLCNKYKIKAQNLEYYCNHREECLDALSKKLNKTREEAKTIYLKC